RGHGRGPAAMVRQRIRGLQPVECPEVRAQRAISASRDRESRNINKALDPAKVAEDKGEVTGSGGSERNTRHPPKVVGCSFLWPQKLLQTRSCKRTRKGLCKTSGSENQPKRVVLTARCYLGNHQCIL